MKDLLRPFVGPLTAQLLEIAVVPTNMAFVLAYVRDKAPHLLSFAALPSQEVIATAELQLLCFRMTILAWVLAMLSFKCVGPFNRWFAAVQAAVRDEKYLVRVELMDYS